MPSTFSVSIGTPTEAYRKPDIYSVLQDIPDNTQKLISPKDVRDAVFSVWANSVFKQTTGTASIEYIGIDSNNPSNRDIKQKIFIGKRNVAGVDIMKNTLLSNTNDTDIFFFNTKSDSVTQSVTKLAILAGTVSSLYDYAPYIKSEYISATSGDNISLEIANPSLYGGPVNIYSSTGRVAINGIIFPTVAESSASASNGKILRYSGTYPNGSLIWSNDTVSIANIGATGSPTNIFGSPVNVNGFPLEFVDDTPVPVAVGGVLQGMTFSSGSFYSQDWPVTEVIKLILYPYVAPSLTFDITNIATGNHYAEFGYTASLIFTYSMTRYSENIVDSQIIGTTFSSFVFSSLPGGIISGTVFGTTASPLTSPVTKSWSLQVSDSVVSSFSHSATASIQFVSPIFYTFDSSTPSWSSAAVGSLINVSNKYIYPYPGASQSYSLFYNGSGYLYLIYPASFATDVTMIKDPNGYIIYDTVGGNISSFTSSSVVPTGTTVSYSAYKIIRTVATCSYPGGYFEFIF